MAAQERPEGAHGSGLIRLSYEAEKERGVEFGQELAPRHFDVALRPKHVKGQLFRAMEEPDLRDLERKTRSSSLRGSHCIGSACATLAMIVPPVSRIESSHVSCLPTQDSVVMALGWSRA